MASTENRRGLKWLGIVVGWSVVIGGGCFLALRAHARTEVENAWSDFAVCLVGEKPLGDEAAALRIRRVQIALAEARDRGERPKDESWPGSCSSYLSRLQDVYVEAGDERRQRESPRGLALEKLSLGLWHPSHHDSADDLQAVFVAFRDVPIRARPAMALPAAPAQLELSDPIIEPAVIGDLSLPPVTTRVVRFREAREGRNWLVPVPASPIETAGKYTRFDAVTRISGKQSLAGAEGEGLTVEALDPLGQSGVYDAITGVRVLQARGLLWGSWTNDAGRVAGIELVSKPAKVGDARAPGWHLIVNAPNEAQSDTLIEGPKCSKEPEPRLVAGHILWLCDGAAGRELYAAQLANDMRSQGALSRIGKLSFLPTLGLENIRACLTPHTLFIDVRDALPNRALLSLRDAKWGLVELSSSGDFSCHEESAAYVTLDVEGQKVRIERMDCAGHACKQARVELELPGASFSALQDGRLSVTTVGDRVALLAPNSARALTLRVAPLPDLAKASSHAMLDIDPSEEGGKDFQSARWLSAQDSAILVVSLTQGSYLLRVTPDGKVHPFARSE